MDIAVGKGIDDVLIGSGVLVNWGGMIVGTESDYEAWHSHEHMAERLSVPGFRRGRRARAVAGTPAERQYFMMYEADTPETFISDPYLQRLNDPTPWTRRVLATYVAPSRTVCRILASQGVGTGGWLATLVAAPPNIAAARSQLGRPDWCQSLLDRTSVVGVHALAGDPVLGQQATAEKRFRESGGSADRTVSIALLIETLDGDAGREAVDRILADAALGAVLGPLEATRYQVQHVMTVEDLSARSTPTPEEATPE